MPEDDPTGGGSGSAFKDLKAELKAVADTTNLKPSDKAYKKIAKRLARAEKEHNVAAREVRLLRRRADRLEGENRYFRRPQERRPYAEPKDKDLAYRLGAGLNCFESGSDPASGGKIASIEFKEFATAITKRRLEDPAERKVIVEGLVYKVVEYVCAAANDRGNMTLYMGVNDDGVVTGVQLESEEIVRLHANTRSKCILKIDHY